MIRLFVLALIKFRFKLTMSTDKLQVVRCFQTQDSIAIQAKALANASTAMPFQAIIRDNRSPVILTVNTVSID